LVENKEIFDDVADWNSVLALANNLSDVRKSVYFILIISEKAKLYVI